MLKIFQEKSFVVEAIENKESQKYIYILKLIDEQHPQFVAFIQKLYIPTSRDGLQMNYYKLQQSFIPMTQDALNSSIRSLLLCSLNSNFTKVPDGKTSTLRII